MEKLRTRLEKFLTSTTTKAQYLESCVFRNIEPNMDKCPPDIWDFPSEVVEALDIYNRLGDRVSEAGYLGKDYTLLGILLDEYNVSNRKLIIEILNIVDGVLIKKSAEEIKKEHEAIKRRAGK